MIIRFVQDYRGKLTGEQFYRAGEEADYPDEVATQLVADDRAVLLAPPPELVPLTPEDLAIALDDVLTGDGSGEALPPIGDPAEERQAPARRRGRREE